ncbi:23S rRNA U2552 (ribose-2'-O)-methylase RlmE/FtsJ [Deinococcus metalli]|uniref:23S rRNA U2552 (Ribose-2'-O)-methylase RlmE/FtsJ n=1 Tax=Deinococcus metalli TaxID=1141878 RepID=A0A7W8KGP5_9DEIO|nr:hypothetical protein [Deinococcus metalli]MBB5376793.1 23S rRNA U2552 (ribose-2'-O)-methylase RlmE/FtsJ [Deinococcus metalli]GHF45385.1 hypothetical protein GCM10017781_22220 [Deinococcus metalli]
MPRYRYEGFQILDMHALPGRWVRISVTCSEHLQPGDELDLRPYGVWRVDHLEVDPSPGVTTLVAVHLTD